MENEIITIEPEDRRSFLLEHRTQEEQIALAVHAADQLVPIIENQGLFQPIKGKKHVNVEGWITLATFMGALPREIETKELQPGAFVSRYELVSLSTGKQITCASAVCGLENDWSDRPAPARYSMAQTRAAAKCCKIAFSWIMKIAGYAATPLEEMTSLKPSPPSPPPVISFAEYEFVINTIKQYHLDEERITTWVKKRWQVDNISDLTSAQALALLVKIPEFAAQVADKNDTSENSGSE